MPRSVMLLLRRGLASASQGVLLMGVVGSVPAMAQSTPIQGIYTCTDAQGRKLTSDRPIAACNDREQVVLNPSGTVKSRVGPTLTAQERNELEVKRKLELEERSRLNEEKRRDKALLIRYPNQSVHDKERQEAQTQVGVVRHAVESRMEELLRQQAALGTEFEFYAKDPSKAPPSLRRQSEDLTQSLVVQRRFVSDLDAETRRINARFDEELVRLKQLWSLHSSAAK
ncbi:DUF4124 domain-containing protein [Rhodoferax sp. PAMC 29310]|uniref:DUF4124 domain-containing protein n=1 Tax=Rhodoferax sp. PAMC 29310 TaxID=2822760 RepID=UPI001F0A761F|nr:DUF4124 domain-containing protein [Rhodoferax sp. PAMC 29310]